MRINLKATGSILRWEQVLNTTYLVLIFLILFHQVMELTGTLYPTPYDLAWSSILIVMLIQLSNSIINFINIKAGVYYLRFFLYLTLKERRRKKKKTRGLKRFLNCKLVMRQ
jgi:hypothetical protein